MVQPTTGIHDSRPVAQDSWRMFDRIARRYDLLNRVLSFRRDVAWRKCLRRHLPDRPDQRVLDLATGTADVLLALIDRADVRRGTGIDRAANMLRIGQRKGTAHANADKLAFARSDAAVLPFADNAFDAVSMAFGIRNVADPAQVLTEIHRVLSPGGRVLILEFSIPQNLLFRGCYLFYFRHVLPRLGGVVSGDPAAYSYLNRSVESFPYGEAFLTMMRDAGFNNLKQLPLTFGIATLYCGEV